MRGNNVETTAVTTTCTTVVVNTNIQMQVEQVAKVNPFITLTKMHRILQENQC